MSLQITQKFSKPSQEEDKFLVQLERYTQNVALAVNGSIKYDYLQLEQPFGNVYSQGNKNVPVFIQSVSFALSGNSTIKAFSLQSPNQGVAFLASSGFVTVGTTSYPIPYNDGTNVINFLISSSGQITINATNIFVGGLVFLSIQYAYNSN